MSRTSNDPDDGQRTDKAKERPVEPGSGPGGDEKLRSEAGPPEQKRTRWLRISRVREPGAPPRNLSVWLGRLRRKKP